MEIKTKFNIGDKVLVVKNEKATEIEINAIVFQNDHIYYSPDTGNIWDKYPELVCFTSEEDIVNYFTSNLRCNKQSTD